MIIILHLTVIMIPQDPLPTTQQSTPILAARDTNTSSSPTKPPKKHLKTDDLINCSKTTIDFGQCLPGSIHQSQVSLSLAFCLDPVMLNVKVLCLDEKLNALPEYVFGLRRGTSNQFGDEFRVKVQEKMPVRFVVGVKVPVEVVKEIRGVLVVEICGIKLEPLLVPLVMKVRIPQIECLRELSSTEQNRIVKVMMRTKTKKQGKIPFKNCQNFRIIGETQVLGLDKNCIVEATPKNILINAKSPFYVTLVLKMTQELKREIESSPGVYKIRRILLIKVKDSTVFYHFPVEISFYQSDKTDSGASE